jgi:hypothetical protein
LIAEARSEKIRHMDEVHAAQKKVADLESRYYFFCCYLMQVDVTVKLNHRDNFTFTFCVVLE